MPYYLFVLILVIYSLRSGKRMQKYPLKIAILIVANYCLGFLATLVGISFFFWLKKELIGMPISLPISILMSYVICVLAGRYTL